MRMHRQPSKLATETAAATMDDEQAGISPQQSRQVPWDRACAAAKTLCCTLGWTLPTADSDPCHGLLPAVLEHAHAMC